MPDNRPFKTYQSLIPAQKTNTSPSFKSPLPEKSFGFGESTEQVPEIKSAKNPQNIPIKTITKTSTTFTKPSPQTSKFHWDPHALKNIGDESFWASLLTILAIPILLLMALFDIIVKAAPWATGPS